MGHPDLTQGAAAPEGTADPAAAAPAQDEIKNLKAEMGRKLGNQEAILAELKKSNDALLAKLAEKEAPKGDGKKLTDVLYENPEQFAAIIEERATTRAATQLAQVTAAQTRQQQTIAQLVSEFPELQSQDHELTKKALEVYGAMGDEEKNHPLAYVTAVKSAALDVGIRPKSKRAQDDDSFQLSGAGAGSSRKERQAASKLDPRTEFFAKAVGLDLSDKSRVERLTKNHGRKSFNSWE